MSGEQTTALAPASEPALAGIERAGFTTQGGFVLLQRGAALLAASTLLPDIYHDNPANCAIVLELSQRLHASPIMVAQNLYIVHGRPGWSSQFLIAAVNQCGRFSPLQYAWQGEAGSDDWGCRATATDLATRREVVGPLVTIAMAKAEGWSSRTGSKWKTIPELMLMYRAATFFARTHSPELTMGLPTREELGDIIDVEGVDTETGEIVGRKSTVIQMPQRRSETAKAAGAAAQESSPAVGTADPSATSDPAQTSGSPAPDQQQAPGAATTDAAPAPAPTTPAAPTAQETLPKPLAYHGQSLRILRVWQPDPNKAGHYVETTEGLAHANRPEAVRALEAAATSNAVMKLTGAQTAYPPAPFQIHGVTLDLPATVKAAAPPSMPAAGDLDFGSGRARREREPGEDDQ